MSSACNDAVHESDSVGRPADEIQVKKRSSQVSNSFVNFDSPARIFSLLENTTFFFFFKKSSQKVSPNKRVEERGKISVLLKGEIGCWSLLGFNGLK